MKSIAIFMLVGLSLFGNRHCSAENADGSNECLGKALEGQPTLVINLIGALSDYDEMKPEDELNEELIEKVSADLQELLSPIGCANQLFKQLESATLKVVAVVSHLDSCGLVKTVRKPLCKVIKALQTDQRLSGIISSLPKTVGAVINTVGGVTGTVGCQKKSSTLDQILEPLNKLSPELAQTLRAVKQAILDLPTQLQKLAGNTSARVVADVVQSLLASADPAVRAVLEATGCVMDTIDSTINNVAGGGKVWVGDLIGKVVGNKGLVGL